MNFSLFNMSFVEQDLGVTYVKLLKRTSGIFQVVISRRLEHVKGMDQEIFNGCRESYMKY